MEQLKQALQGFKDGWQAPLPRPVVWAIRVVFLVALAVILLRK